VQAEWGKCYFTETKQARNLRVVVGFGGSRVAFSTYMLSVTAHLYFRNCTNGFGIIWNCTFSVL
jgi:hypothetical protein